MLEVVGKTLEFWTEKEPIIEEIVDGEPVFWVNDRKDKFELEKDQVEFSADDIQAAEARLNRFAPFIAENFEDTKELNGLIESPISKIDNFKNTLENTYNVKLEGDLYLKRDDLLPIAGTIKARGAIYEVLVHAEKLAIEKGLIENYDDDYTKFSNKESREFFSNYKVVVGTTGNLGISVGVMAAKLGFEAIIHMSVEAKQWKKNYLRNNGVKVVEHKTNFTAAVAKGRAESDSDPSSYFVDDENSTDLFLGYTTAASRLKKQLEEKNITVDEDHPLFVYLPCGVGGSPGGITFGLKHLFGDNVYAFFGEPATVPSLLLGLLTKEYSDVSVNDFGLDGSTVMDGLAVPRTSKFVAQVMERFFDGGYTLTEDEANRALTRLVDTEDIWLEPAAVAGLLGPARLLNLVSGDNQASKNILNKIKNATHISWATGGSMVPEEDKQAFYQQGKNLIDL